MDRKLQRHRADSLRQHGFLVISSSRAHPICGRTVYIAKCTGATHRVAK